MKALVNITVVLALAVVIGIAVTGCKGEEAKDTGAGSTTPEPTTTAAQPNAAVEVWTCAMHPQIRLPKPGKCPICAMNLITVKGEKEEGETTGGHEGASHTGAHKTTLAAQTKCPIMKGKINKGVYVDYEGKRIYLCCPACEGTFNKDPEKHIKLMKGQGITLADVPTDAAQPAPEDPEDHSGHAH